MRRLLVVASFVFLVPAAAGAQDIGPVVIFPGSLNFTSGTVAPSEHNNVITTAAMEQGIDIWHRKGLAAIAYGDITLKRDTSGYAWNNNTPMAVGAKLVANGAWGVAQAGAGLNVLVEGGRMNHTSKSIALSYWNGWRGDAVSDRLRRFPAAFPGTMWASSGYVTAAEPDNWITTARVEQGMTIFSRRNVSLIPYGAAAANADTRGYAWNNRTQFDAGIKLAHPFAGGVVDVAFAERRELSGTSGLVRTGPVVTVDMWLGWNPRYTRK